MAIVQFFLIKCSILVPELADEVLVVDCSFTKATGRPSVYTVGGSSNVLRSGRHRIPQDGRYKYLYVQGWYDPGYCIPLTRLAHLSGFVLYTGVER